MPARLVYAPKAYVYTKDQSGATYDLSPWVVSGQVQRLINQVSSAEVTLRNPQKRFTTPSSGVAFHPMDPITIYLERIAGYPVRVFTGYLDETPYYQMYPGAITLTASCTLKRLEYTYFDPSLPFINAFFAQYGWISNQQGSIYNLHALGSSVQNISTANLQDSSIGKLIWATLYEIGDWQDTNIYVENLPDGIAQRMAALMQALNKEQQIASEDFNLFMSKIIGSGSQGSGGGNSGNSNSVPQNVKDAWLKAERQQETGPPNGNYKQNSGGCQGAYCWTNTWSSMAAAAGQSKWASKPAYEAPPSVQDAVAWHVMGPYVAKGQFAEAAMVWNGGQPHSVPNPGIPPADGCPGGSSAGYACQVINKFKAILKSMGLSYPPKVSPTKTINPPSNTSGNIYSNNDNGNLRTSHTKNTNNNNSNNNSSSGGASGIALQALHRQQQLHCFYYSQTRPIQYDILTNNPEYIDCSGFVTACYKLAGWGDPNHYNYNGSGSGFSMMPHARKLAGEHEAQPGDVCYYGNPLEHVTIYVGNGQVVSMGQQGDPSIGPAAQMGPSPFLGYYRQDTFEKGGASVGNSGGAAGSTTNTNTAEAFVAELNFPTVEDMMVAMMLGAEGKGLMHDQSLLPFIQELCQASLRSFQSLPNGDFYAFYPDYFGEFGHHPPYWLIDDIELLDGGINLTDDALATHVYAVGDNTWAVSSNPETSLLNMLFSAGDINIFNAFMDPSIIDTSTTKNTGGLNRFTTAATGAGAQAAQRDMSTIMTQDEAVQFIERYGARPLVLQVPQVRSSIFEMLLAYQQFMLAWSNQFLTPFTFTFMPELYPGGKVGFPNHGIQMYINAVTHTWDYTEGGFQTQADLMAPSLLAGVDAANFPDLPPNMIRALVEPIEKGPPGSVGNNNTPQSQQKVSQGLQSLGRDLSNPSDPPPNIGLGNRNVG